MRLRIEVDDRASVRLEELSGRRLSESRRRLVEQAMRQTLQDVVRLNPVDTGRSRSAWVAALRQAGWEVPGGWQGPRSDASAIAQGAGLGELARSEPSSSMTMLSAHNRVRYVGFLEYGTRRMAPFAMVRRALAVAQQQLAGWFRFPPG